MKVGKFTRGTVVYHKVMGKGVAINELENGNIEVRMQNGQKERFYPEELETEAGFDARNRNEITGDKNWRIGS